MLQGLKQHFVLLSPGAQGTVFAGALNLHLLTYKLCQGEGKQKVAGGGGQVRQGILTCFLFSPGQRQEG